MARGAQKSILTNSKTKSLTETARHQREAHHSLRPRTREKQIALIEEARAARLAYAQEQSVDHSRFSR